MPAHPVEHRHQSTLKRLVFNWKLSTSRSQDLEPPDSVFHRTMVAGSDPSDRKRGAESGNV
ncbi:MAG: hypothetical protein C5B57_10145 [Blastocatellia bacterium]|nr:MAG: hypothetical protein C5B57_10145 [Blastocatellia bacterium]